MTLSTVVIISFSLFLCSSDSNNKCILLCAVRLKREDEAKDLCEFNILWTLQCLSCTSSKNKKSNLNLSAEDHSCILNQLELPTSLSTVWHLWKVSEDRKMDRSYQELWFAAITILISHMWLCFGWSCEKQLLSHGPDNAIIATAP